VSLIDGQYLSQIISQTFPAGTVLDLSDFASRITPRFHWRFRTYYFDALPYRPHNNPSGPQSQAHATKQAELKRIARFDRFTVREGYCTLAEKRGRISGRPNAPLERFETVEQKLVDVLLATELTRIAWSREAQHVSLIAGDADFVPAIQAAKNAGALVRLYYFRGGTTSYGDRLFDEADERFDLRPILDDIRLGRSDPRRAQGTPAPVARPTP
jgi:uncharacterized LabA/DUF88 family protein